MQPAAHPESRSYIDRRTYIIKSQQAMQLTYPPFVFWRHHVGDLRGGPEHCTVQAPPTGQLCITMLSNRYASIPCQATLRPAIYGPILGRQFMGQFKAGKIMGQFMADIHWILTHLSTDLGSSPLYSQLKLSHHMSMTDSCWAEPDIQIIHCNWQSLSWANQTSELHAF